MRNPLWRGVLLGMMLGSGLTILLVGAVIWYGASRINGPLGCVRSYVNDPQRLWDLTGGGLMVITAGVLLYRESRRKERSP